MEHSLVLGLAECYFLALDCLWGWGPTKNTCLPMKDSSPWEKSFSGCWLIGILQDFFCSLPLFISGHLVCQHLLTVSICFQHLPRMEEITWYNLVNRSTRKEGWTKHCLGEEFCSPRGEMGRWWKVLFTRVLFHGIKKHINVSQEENCHGQWQTLKTFFYNCNSPPVWWNFYVGIPTHISFPDPLHFIISSLRPRPMRSLFFLFPMTSRRMHWVW